MTQLKLLAGKNGVRIRETPVDGKPVGQLYESDVFEALDSLDTLREKLGVNGEWVKIKTAAGLVAYVAAWFVESIEPLPEPEPADEPEPAIDAKAAAAPGDDEDAKIDDAGAAGDEEVVALMPTVNGLRLRAEPVDGDPRRLPAREYGPRFARKRGRHPAARSAKRTSGCA